MPYTRRLHLVWAAFDHPGWAREACEAALPISDGRIEHRHADGPNGLDRADLVITLDAAARAGLPPLPSRVQVRHLDLELAADAAARRTLVATRVAGILGGLRLLDRLESVERP
jgi:hypothetical protein